MYSHIFQKFLKTILVMTLAVAVQPQEHEVIRYIDKKIPKYEYGYIVSDKEGNAQGHVESRDGIFALGKYYVSLPNGTGQKVTYFADDLGYHPLVSYASASSKGSSRTQLIMGEKAIAALSDIFSLKNSFATTNIISTTPASITSFTAGNDFISTNYTPSEQSNLYLAAPITTSIAKNLYTQSGNIIPPFDSLIESSLKNTKKSHQSENKAVEYKRKNVTNPQFQEGEYHTILHIPELKQNYQIVTNGLEKPLEEESITNNSQTENLYHNNNAIKNILSSSSSMKKGNEEQIAELSSYFQFANRNTTNTDQTVTEDQTHVNVLSPTQIFSTNTMKPIIVPAKFQSESQKVIFSAELPPNSVATNINNQNGYNEINQTSLPSLFNSFTSISLIDPTISKHSDSASQSSNSVVVNQSDIAINEATGTAHSVNPLTALQAGISIFSSENTKPNQKVIEENNVKYKTVVDIQEGISLDVMQNPDSSFGLVSNYGQRIPSQKVPQYRGLAYESRLINPEAINIVQEINPVVKQQKQEELLRRQEAEILAVQKSIEELQQQIIDQIDAEHEEEQKKQKKVHEEKENYLQNLQNVDALIQDQKSIQSNYNPIQVLPNEQRDEGLSIVENPQFATVNPSLSQVQPFHDQIIVDSVASAEHDKQTEIANNIQNSIGVQSEDNNKIVDGEFIGNVEIPTQLTVKSQNLAGLLMLHSRENIQTQENLTARDAIALQNSPIAHLDYPHYKEQIVNLVPPSVVVTNQDSPTPVLLEPHPVEHESKLLPVSPPPTLFPIKIDTPTIIEKPTKISEEEKSIVEKQSMQFTKVVEVEKPVPVLQPYPIEVTKFVHVDRPIPIPTPFTVSHPVPVPVAIPHPVEVPVPHLIPVPEILPIALKEYYPVFIHKNNKESSSKSTIKQQSIPKKVHTLANQRPSVADLRILGSSFGDNANFHSYKSDGKRKPHLQAVNMIVKQNPELDQSFRSDGHGMKQGIDWDVFMAQYGSDLQFSDESLTDIFEHMYKTGIPVTLQGQSDSFQTGHREHDRKRNVLRNLRIEYGFKPPLRPSVQIMEEVKPSIFGPSIRPDK